MILRLAVPLLALLLASGALAADPAPAAAPEGPTVSALPEPTPFDSATTARYLRAARALAKAVATDDAKEFRALFTDAAWARADDWTTALLVNQKRKFGAVTTVHGLFRGVLMMGKTGVGLPPEGAAILLRFAREGGASLSFTLAPDGRVATSSLWVAVELAGASNDGAELLWAMPGREAKP